MGAKFIKLLVLVIGIAAVDIIVLSPGMVGLRIGESAMQTAAGITLLVASALLLLYASYAMLFRQPAAVKVREIQSRDDFEQALSRFRRVKPLEGDIALALSQIERMDKKQETLRSALGQRFAPGELSYGKFASVIEEVEKLFYLNIRSVLNRLNVFDEAEYRSITAGGSSRLPPQLLEEKAALYQAHLIFVKQSLATNEEMLLKLDKLLVEISRLDGIEPGDIEGMPGMQEIDALIKQTKFYRQ
ncbi:hypothetical protein [Cohnella sp. REN36]|uniref:hypothetical protein n=1 Tax=Cohnella sp. REN36 TaxID=2887347 RepID=UPI001D134336|nr:hypothetical protein [Cohnella sp. REN36]MCC3371540.1 hypothetical protein [Cohnella sp. REN36]